jgi:hypothetical protein
MLKPGRWKDESFVLFGRVFQVISAGLVAFGLFWLLAAELGLAPDARG